MAQGIDLTLHVPAFISAEGVQIRTAGEQGSSLFCLTDVCKVLGSTNPSVVATRLDDDEKVTLNNVDSVGRPHANLFINEAGLYHVVLTSRAKNAHLFKRWVFHEVLPCIREHGCYPAPLHQHKSPHGPNDDFKNVLLKLMEQQTAILERFTRMDDARREGPPADQLIGVQDRIREMLGSLVTTRRQRSAIMSRVLGRLHCNRTHTTQLTRSGPHLIDRCHMAVIDNEVDRFKRELDGKLSQRALPFTAE